MCKMYMLWLDMVDMIFFFLNNDIEIDLFGMINNSSNINMYTEKSDILAVGILRLCISLTCAVVSVPQGHAVLL